MRIIPESKMADSEEEDFVALGTPFEQLEEDVPRKKPVPIHEQIVTDDRGRRRFHGAFTGGFSAGYFNTVDTKEGWAPKSFVSSRSQKATEQTTQRPEDFMDEEDLSEFGIAPKRVVTTQKFLPTNSDGRKQTVNVASDSGTGLLGERLLQDLIVPVKMSVGVKLLSQMGWKEGQGVGPKVRRAVKKTYGCAGPPGTDMVQAEDEEDIYAVGLFFAPKDVEALNFTSKDNLHGIGYSGIDPKTALLSQRDWLGMDPSSSSIGIRGQGFGVGALEDDDEDIYSQDHLSNYDIELSTPTFKRKNDLHGWTGPQQFSGQGGLLSIFCKASKPPPARKHYPPPVVPRDFKPIHKIEETAEDKQPLSNHPGKQVQEVEKETQSAKRLTAKERGEALGETPLPIPKKSVFDYITEEDKSRLKESKEKAKVTKEHNKLLGNDDLQRRFTSRGPISNSGFKPFAKDPGKQARYERYISGKSHADSSQTDSKMTEWERECELEEFARAAVLYRPLNQTMAARFTTAKESEESVENKDSGTSEQSNAAKMKMFGALTRERFKWHPDKILCKRFNIPNPYPGSGFTGVVRNRQEKIKTDKPVKREVKAIEYKPHSSSDNETKSSSQQDDTEMTPKPSALVAGFQSIVSQRKHLPNQDTSAGSSREAADKEEPNTDKQNSESDENVIKRAPMDLFNEIFAESSSESDSESEENEEIEQSKNVEGDVKTNTERNDEGVEKSSVLPSSDPPVPIPESNTPADEVVEREPSPEAFGPALPSSFTGNTSSQRPSKAEFQFSTREDSPRRRDKQKHTKKKKRRNKDSDSDITDSDDGYSRRRKDKKKKRSKKKENDWTDSDEHQSKKSKKKTRVEDTDSDLTDSESEESTRHKKKKSKYSKDRYTKHKKNKKRETLYDSDDSSNDEHTKHKKYKRNKEKTEKERKKYTDKNSKNKQSDSPECKKYKPEEYVEEVSRSFTNANSSRTFISEQGQSSSSGLKREKHSGNSRKDTSEGVRNPGVERTGNDPEESQVARVPDSKEIINKLKNIQMLKERKRMRAADFM